MRMLLAAACCAALLLTSCIADPVSDADSAPEIAASQAESDLHLYLTQAEISALPAGTLVQTEQLDPNGIAEYFTAEPISDRVFKRINGVSYQENPYVSRDDLRYLRVLHFTADGSVRCGEIIVHKLIAEDICEIMHQLYQAEYPIEQMRLIDDYGGSDDESMDDNNTSAFNYRNVRGTERLSRHALGLAVDINPLYNPYITTSPSGIELIVPKNAIRYTDRKQEIPMKIT